MLPIPAIDIQSGKCVRLQKGDLSSTKVYFEKPVDAAAHWIKEGTKKQCTTHASDKLIANLSDLS